MQDASGSVGFGAVLVESPMYYYCGQWSAPEIAAFDINILEAVVECFSIALYGELAVGCKVVHVIYECTDNTTAQNVGHTFASKERLGRMDKILSWKRGLLKDLHATSVQMRITTTQNKLSDLLSRGHEQEFLRRAVGYGYSPVRLTLPPHIRDLSWLF